MKRHGVKIELFDNLKGLFRRKPAPSNMNDEKAPLRRGFFIAAGRDACDAPCRLHRLQPARTAVKLIDKGRGVNMGDKLTAAAAAGIAPAGERIGAALVFGSAVVWSFGGTLARFSN